MELLFNRALHRLRRDKAAATLHEVDFILQAAAERLADRLLDIDRRFPLAVDMGCHHGMLAQHLSTAKVGQLVQCDLSPHLLQQAPSPLRLAVDEECLPFAENRISAIFSVLSLQWVNDLPGCLIQCQKALVPDGLFLAVMPGPHTLRELRESLVAVSAERGLSPRISPFVEVRDAGNLLQRAGFALPVVDNELLTVTYAEPMKLLRELQQMGENNALCAQHKGMTAKDFWPQVLAYYQQHYANADGRLPVTVELVFLTGWKPHASQQQPAKRGSGQVNLTQLFGTPDKES